MEDVAYIVGSTIYRSYEDAKKCAMKILAESLTRNLCTKDMERSLEYYYKSTIFPAKITPLDPRHEKSESLKECA